MAPKIGYFQIAQIYPLRCQRCQIKRNKCEGTHHAKCWQYADGSASWFGDSTFPSFVHHHFERIVPWGTFYGNEAVALKTCSGCVSPISRVLLHHFTPSSAPGSMWSWVEAEPLRWGFAAPQAGSCLLGGQTNQPTNQPQSNRDQQRGMGGGTGLTRLSKSTFRGAGGVQLFLGWVGSEVDRIWSNVQRVTIPVRACSQVKRRILAGHQRPWACAAQNDYCAVKMAMHIRTTLRTKC